MPIEFITKIWENADGIQIRVETPAANATSAEINAGRKFKEMVDEFRIKACAKLDPLKMMTWKSTRRSN